MIGIGGIGMSGLARLLLQKKCLVTGSDPRSNSLTEELSKMGATVSTRQMGELLEPNSHVVYTTDIGKTNAEWLRAEELKCTLLHRSELLQELAKDHVQIAITGAHGKTTTTALMTSVLVQAGLDPSFAIGGEHRTLGTNARLGSGPHFVLEADESDGTFTRYTPSYAIVTNIDWEHMEYWKSQEAMLDGYDRFIDRVDHLFICGDDPHLAKYSPRAITYGFSPHNECYATDVRQDRDTLRFNLIYKGKLYPNVRLKGIGRHLVLNALGVFSLATELGVNEALIRQAFAQFGGVKRRLEKKLDRYGVWLFDDYAHHPTEIEATLLGVKEAYPERRLVAILQPHRYTRTKRCLGQFKKALQAADEVIVTDLYSAAEEPIEGVDAHVVAKEAEGRYLPRHGLVSAIQNECKKGDLVLAMGAGDITYLADEFPKIKVAILFGGRSAEHSVSCSSAKGIYGALDDAHYDKSCIAILPTGEWVGGELAKNYLLGHPVSQPQQILSKEVLDELKSVDIVFPVLHGPWGEDGTVQGLFETLEIPYVGCSLTACASTMDKVIAKMLFIANGQLTAPFHYFTESTWARKRDEVLAKIERELPYPLFVKPTNLGSSIGIGRVTSRQELVDAIELAFKYGPKVIVEREIRGREIEFGIIGNDELTIFHPGEVLKGNRHYCYEGKYSGDPAKAIAVAVKADISEEVVEELKKSIELIYRAFDCRVLARIDCFLDADNRLWFSEINPMPGCTPTSLMPKMAEAAGISFSDLVDRLISYSLVYARKATS